MALKSDLDAVWTAYISAYRRGDGKGCAAVFAPDAVMVSPFGPQASGRAEIAAQHADWVADDAGEKTITILDFGGSGELAWCFARFSEGDPDGQGDGVSLSVFERDPQTGTWRITYCSLNE